MTLVKDGAKPKKQIAVKDNSFDPKASAAKIAERVGTARLVWLLVYRHRVGLLLIGNIVLVLNWVFPPWPQIVLGLIGK